MAVRLSGFADEAADTIDEQIAVTRELGWNSIELRTVNGANVVDLVQEQFQRLTELMAANAMTVNAVGSTIANWGSSIEEPETVALRAAERAIGRMHDLGTTLIRIMSWQVIRDGQGRAEADQREPERIRRLRALSELFVDAGITPVHENCANWGGMSPDHTLRMLEAVPGLKLVFDTGNPPLTEDFAKPWPYPYQSTRDYWNQIKQHVVHIHIKDSRHDPQSGDEQYCWPGEGDGDVAWLLRDLESIDYQGYLSIEPHMTVVFHDDSVSAPQEARRRNYLEYGRRLETMLKELGIAFER